MRSQRFFPWRMLVLILILLALALLVPRVQSVLAQDEAVAHVILFHSPTCPHCRYVVNEVLPVLQEQFGDQLEIQYYNLQELDGALAIQALRERWPEMPSSIPQAYISDYVLVGSIQIPDELPGIIEGCLAVGGCDWPFTFSSTSDHIDSTASSQNSDQVSDDPDMAPIANQEVVVLGMLGFTVLVAGLIYFRFMR